MQIINIDKLLERVSEEAPCGENLEYDPALQRLEHAATSKITQEFGETVVLAEEPNWNNVQTLAIDLLYRTKDLRILSSYLTPAMVQLEGFQGCAQILSLARGYLEQYWDTVHPQLDPDDDYDPVSRVNAIGALGDLNAVVQSLRRSPLASAQGFGVVSLRDMDVATGKITLPENEETAPPTIAIIEGVFIESESESLKNKASAIDDSLTSIKDIRKKMVGEVGLDNTPEFSELSSALVQAKTALNKELSRRGVVDSSKNETEQKDDEGVQEKSQINLAGKLNTRADVVRTLDEVCDYYARHEPSSPVPLLLQRAKRLASMDFMEILRNLTPDGIPQAENIIGVKENKT